METLDQIKTLVETLSVDNWSNSMEVISLQEQSNYQTAQELKNLLQELRKEILEERNKG